MVSVCTGTPFNDHTTCTASPSKSETVAEKDTGTPHSTVASSGGMTLGDAFWRINWPRISPVGMVAVWMFTYC